MPADIFKSHRNVPRSDSGVVAHDLRAAGGLAVVLLPRRSPEGQGRRGRCSQHGEVGDNSEHSV